MKNDLESTLCIAEMALICNGNNEQFSALSKLFIDALTVEARPGLRSLKPKEDIVQLLINLHLAQGLIKSMSREELLQDMLVESNNAWLVDRLFGRPGAVCPQPQGST